MTARGWVCLTLPALLLLGCERPPAQSPVQFGQAQLQALKAGDGSTLVALRVEPERLRAWNEAYERLHKSGELDSAAFDQALLALKTVAENGSSPASDQALADVRGVLSALLDAVESHLATHFDQDPYLSREQRDAAKGLSSALFKQVESSELLSQAKIKQLAARYQALLSQAQISSYADLSRADAALAPRISLLIELARATLEASGVDPQALLDGARVLVLQNADGRALIATTVAHDGQTLRYTEWLLKRQNRWFPAPQIPAKN